MISRHGRVSIPRLALLCSGGAALLLVGCASTPPRSESAASGSGPPESCEPKVGDKAPALSARAASGAGTITLPKGKVTLVDFWATWCKPCEKSFPKYQELYVKYKASGLEIMAVSVDEDDQRNEIAAWAAARGARFPIGWDEGHKLAKCWKPDPMPTMFIVDKDGVVRHVHRRWEAGDEKKLEEQIKALL